MSDEQRLPYGGEVWTNRQTGFAVTVERVVPGLGGDAVHLADGSMMPGWQFLKAYAPKRDT